MHSLMRRLHDRPPEAAGRPTRGLVMDTGWRYDLMEWLFGGVLFHGKLREMRRRTAELAVLQPGETALDVGCGTGTLAIELAGRMGPAGRVYGIDPGPQQIARARAKAARRGLSIDFRVGVIERLDFPDQTFDVVFSTIMMHHLGDALKRQGLAEISRVLKPGGRLVIADFKRPGEQQAMRAPFGSVQDLPGLVEQAGFGPLQTEEMPFPHFASGVIFVKAVKP